MRGSPPSFKFLFAFSLPPLIILFAIVGADHFPGYGLLATPVIIGGAICVATAVHERQTKWVIGIIYGIVVEVLMLLLP